MRLVILAAVAVLCLANVALADDWDSFVKAPPNHAILSETLNGWIFVPTELKDVYDSTLRRLESLQSELDDERITAKEAKAELAELKSRLKLLRQEIEASRVEVQGAKIHEQTESSEFELGPEKRLAITANHVRVIGWDGPKVKVELKKLVLSSDKKPVDDALKAVSIVHKHEIAQFAGQTDAQWEAEEAEFMAKDGAKLNKEQLENRRKLVDEIRQSRAHYREWLAKEIDQLSITGLDYSSNKFIEKKVKSDGGSGQVGSVRQRYGELTVYVPACTSVCIRGARRGLHVENLSASLMIVNEDYTDSDARGEFNVVGLHGNLLCRDFPLRTVSDVEGRVKIESTTEFGIEGAGTNHHDGLRNMTPGRPFKVDLRNVSEGVELHYGRVQLNLEKIGGTINVVNEFGDTRLVLDAPLADAAHRVTSHSGRIDVELSDAAWQSIPVLAFTNHGRASTNIGREVFDDFHISGQDKHDQVRRDWSGFRTVVADEDRFAVFQLIDRFSAIMDNNGRTGGLDLLTRSGTVAVLRK